MKRVAVIGAGLSGLIAAQHLSDSALVTVFEKSRGPAGRLATRDAQSYQFDHGAQFFGATTQAFKLFLQPLIAEGQVAPWHAQFVVLDGDRVTDDSKDHKQQPVYVALPTMNQLGKHLASGMDVRFICHVAQLERTNSDWQLIDRKNTLLGNYDWIITAIPAAQCLDIMPSDFQHIDTIKQVLMMACYTLMLGFSKPLQLPWQAARVLNSDISRIVVNSSKPGRPEAYSLVVHSNNTWAEAHLDDDPQDVQVSLLRELADLIGRDIHHAQHCVLHRWRYANAEEQTDKLVLLDAENRLAACGDWCVQGSVEGAFISAASLVTKLRPML